ncbi:thiamine pyrophosphate-binding protein [Saxibacter everestensis]|uniref:Thiamine pyrophosphate-binding protein n=1 Tax=Saxibacter everestensis TaxID=2909229 RepID=A0ABY8QQK7_9MICO|nr:thiamine pyrophosphate-binding protein [Brevibacteriaceae bacterium ZFBP1038]
MTDFAGTPEKFRNGALAVVSTLHAHGVEMIFGIPGTHNLEFYRHLKTFGIRAVTPRHEQGAGYAADGYWQVTGKPGVVITTSGPGLTNVITAAATAYAESRPMLVLSPGVPVGLERADAGLLHETKDASGAIEHLLLWSRRTRTAEGAAQAVADAFATFRSGRPGPVHIEVPLDILEGSWSGSPAAQQQVSRPVANQDAVAAAAEALASAGRPLIVAGGGACHASTEVTRLAETLDAPVVTTVNGKGVLDELHPLSLGANIRLRAIQDESAKCDVILVVGTELADSDLWGGRIGGEPDAPARPLVIRCDIDPDQLHKNLPGKILGHGDAGEFLAAIQTRLTETHRSEPAGGESGSDAEHDAGNGPTGADVDRSAGGERAAKLREASYAEAEPDYPVAPAICAAVRAAMNDDAILTGDSSQITYLGSVHFFAARKPYQHLYMPGFATLGYGIPAAIGAKLGAPDNQVVCLLGDGAAMFSIQEIMTAVELELAIPIVIIDNGGYREIQDQMDSREMEHVGVKLRRPDFAALGESMGARGVRTTRVEDLTSLVSDALSCNGPTIITLDLTS